MKWIVLNQTSPVVHLFNLVDHNTVKETLRYNIVQQSVRLTSNQRQRVYFIEHAGFRHSQYVFKNEYGFESGRIYTESTSGSNGFLDSGKGKSQYTFKQKPSPELVLYEEDGIKPRLICALQPAINNMEVGNTFGPEQASLLWGLYWYLTEPVENEAPARNKVAVTTYL